MNQGSWVISPAKDNLVKVLKTSAIFVSATLLIGGFFVAPVAYAATVSSQVGYYTVNNGGPIGTSFIRSLTPQNLPTAAASGTVSQISNPDGSVTANISNAPAYADSGFYVNGGTLSNLKSVLVRATPGSDQFGFNIWFDKNGDNEFFTWDAGNTIYQGTGSDSYILGPSSQSGILLINDASQFNSMQPGGGNYTLAQLKSGAASGINGSTKIAFWVGVDVGSGGSKSATIQSLDINGAISPISVNAAWVGSSVGTEVAPGKVFGYNAFGTIPAAINAANPGDTIVLGADATIASQINIANAVTLDGAGHRLNATFTKTSNSNNAAIGITHSDVTIKNLVEDGTGSTNLHGINIYVSTGVVLDTVTVSNNGHAGVVVNGSTVTVNNITTTNNGWGGIDVDQGSEVTSPAILTVNGTSSHTETGSAIWKDDNSKTNVSVVDTNNQYASSTYTHDANVTGTKYTLINKVNINGSTPKVVITNPTQPVNVTIADGTTNPTIDVSAFVNAGTGTLPEIDITSANANNANVVIPASTVVTSADPTWNGVIAAPTVTTVTLPVAVWETKTLSTAIEVGFTGAKLSFTKAVRILLPGQAGKSAGYIRTGTAFTEITNTCAADNQATGDALPTDGDCKINVAPDLVIWTKHFTTFATYTLIQYGGVGGGSSPAPAPAATTTVAPAAPTAPATTPTTPAAAPAIAPATAPTGQVLGASTYNFAANLGVGSRGDAVTELQKRLTDEGVYGGPVTGYFGKLTEAAVKAYQSKNSLPQTGLVGIMTRGSLNGSKVAGVKTTSDEVILAKIAALKAQLDALQKQLEDLNKQGGQ